MKTRTTAALLFLFSVAPLSLLNGMVQSVAPCSIGARADGSFGVNPKINAPFVAKVKETFEQKLPGGNVVSGFARFGQARSQMGATRMEAPQRCFTDQDGTVRLAYEVTTFDPVSKSWLSWGVYGEALGWAEHVVHVRVPVEQTKPEVPEQGAGQTARTRPASTYVAAEYREEQLGTRVMLGLMVTGTRMVRTVPAGKEGNEQAFEILREHWWSRDLEQDLQVIEDDPRRGKMTFEVEELTLGEPNAALFVPPEGYVRKAVVPM